MTTARRPFRSPKIDVNENYDTDLGEERYVQSEATKGENMEYLYTIPKMYRNRYITHTDREVWLKHIDMHIRNPHHRTYHQRINLFDEILKARVGAYLETIETTIENDTITENQKRELAQLPKLA